MLNLDSTSSSLQQQRADWEAAKKQGRAATAPELNQFRTLSDWGYTVVPIIPGKKWPGQKIDGYWKDLAGWSTHKPTTADLEKWHTDGAGVGIVSGPDVLALDIDITDENLADAVERSAIERFGIAPLRVGNPPKRALFYRVDQPIKKTTSGSPSEGTGIEFRTGNHQTVAYGIHPTGSAYRWPRPLVAKGDLPLVKIDDLRAFKAEWDEILGAVSKPIVVDKVSGIAIDQEKLKGPYQLVAAAVDAIPNDARPYFDRGWWIKACHALAAASSDFPAEGYALWISLCERHPSFDETDATETWDTIGLDHQVGADWLCVEALRFSDSFGQVLIDYKGWFSAEAEGEPALVDAPSESPGLFLFLDEDVEDQIEPQDPFGYGPSEHVLDLPAGTFPDIIDAWARDTGERMGVPAAYSATCALATVAAAIGNKLWIQPKANDTSWKEPAILWVLLAEGVGGMKTPSMDAATKPLREVDHESAKDGARRYSEWEIQRKIAKGREAVLALPPEPKIKRSVVVDITTEALGAVLSDNRSGVLIYQDELAALLGSLDAYKSSKGGDRAKMLKLFNGGTESVDRVGRKHIPIDFWGASIIGGIQPRKLQELSGNLDADGLLQRFLPIYGDGSAQTKDEVDREPDLVAEQAYFGVVKKWARAPDIEAVVKLSPEAQEVWKPVRARIAKLLFLPGLSEAWKGHLSKWAGISSRLLLLCHVLDHVERETHEIDTIAVSTATARRASRLVDFLLANSLRFYTECIGAGETIQDARWIAGGLTP